jgi:hypothetical protein
MEAEKIKLAVFFEIWEMPPILRLKLKLNNLQNMAKTCSHSKNALLNKYISYHANFIHTHFIRNLSINLGRPPQNHSFSICYLP